jgi:hypothetical protein
MSEKPEPGSDIRYNREIAPDVGCFALFPECFAKQSADGRTIMLRLFVASSSPSQNWYLSAF